MCAKHPAGNIFSSFWVEVAEPSTADFERDVVFLQEQFLKFLPIAGTDGAGFDCGAKEILLCLECRSAYGKAVRQNLPVAFVQFLLPPPSRMIFTVCNFLCRRRKKVYLMQMFPMAQIHKGLL